MREARDSDRPPQLYAAMRHGHEIQPTTRQWLWPGRIPRGAVTVLAGDRWCVNPFSHQPSENK